MSRSRLPGRKRMDVKPKPVPDRDEERACREHQEALLDEALEESFPASDPPSMATSPSRALDD